MGIAHAAWRNRTNTFETSAVGRLFDAAAAMVLGRDTVSFEGQGPMELEHIAASDGDPLPLPLEKDENGILRCDWSPLLDMLTDNRLPAESRAGLFHESMAQALVDQVCAVREFTDFEAVGLSGGVFQNRWLVERVAEKLGSIGVGLRLHREIPANDGGLSFGQIIEAAAVKVPTGGVKRSKE